eukprot:1195654-Prorocentrum_minimum.AAC.2
MSGGLSWRGHNGAVAAAVAVGERVATLGESGAVRLWGAACGADRAEWEGCASAVEAALTADFAKWARTEEVRFRWCRHLVLSCVVADLVLLLWILCCGRLIHVRGRGGPGTGGSGYLECERDPPPPRGAGHVDRRRGWRGGPGRGGPAGDGDGRPEPAVGRLPRGVPEGEAGDGERQRQLVGGGAAHRPQPGPYSTAKQTNKSLDKICFTGIDWKIVSTYEPKVMLTNSPA